MPLLQQSGQDAPPTVGRARCPSYNVEGIDEIGWGLFNQIGEPRIRASFSEQILILFA